MGFWTGKRACVTGGAGFVGSHLVRLLLDAGASVAVLDNNSRGHAFVKGALYRVGDATELNVCRQVFRGCDAVFNLAAEVAGVIYNQERNFRMFARNIDVQITPIAAAVLENVPLFLQVSSVCIYAPGYTDPCQERNGQAGEPVGANAGYSWSKRMGERAVAWSDLQHAVIVRPSNIYGPGDYYDDRAHVIPALIKKCLTEPELVVNGTGAEMREFLYVEDAARGMMHALEHGAHGEAYNLGTDGQTCVPIAYLVDLLQEMTNTGHKRVRYTSEYSAGDAARWSDASKARGIGWEFSVPLAIGLSHTVAAYEASQERVSA